MSADNSLILAPDIHARLGRGGWASVLEQLGVSSDYLRGPRKQGPCPLCGGRDRYVFDDRTGRGDYLCRKCGSGDGFDLLRKLHRWTFPETIQHIAEKLGLATQGGHRRSEKARKNQADNYTLARLRRDQPELADWSDRAESIWRQTLPLGEIARAYLRSRGCLLPPPDGHLRYLAHSERYPHPTLVALVTDVVTAKPISLHLTRLARDGSGKAGTDKDRMLLKGHRKRGGVIRLWPDECVTSGLAVAEGIETALALAHGFQPVWSAIDAGNLALLPILRGIESLTIAADHDEAGIEAAATLGQRWADAGRAVLIATPEPEGFDVADLVAA